MSFPLPDHWPVSVTGKQQLQVSSFVFQIIHFFDGHVSFSSHSCVFVCFSSPCFCSIYHQHFWCIAFGVLHLGCQGERNYSIRARGLTSNTLANSCFKNRIGTGWDPLLSIVHRTIALSMLGWYSRGTDLPIRDTIFGLVIVLPPLLGSSIFSLDREIWKNQDEISIWLPSFLDYFGPVTHSWPHLPRRVVVRIERGTKAL